MQKCTMPEVRGESNKRSLSLLRLLDIDAYQEATCSLHSKAWVESSLLSLYNYVKSVAMIEYHSQYCIGFLTHSCVFGIGQTATAIKVYILVM